MSEKQLTVRGVVTGIVGMLVITASSMFLALKIGTMPWPILFSTILSMAIVGNFRGSSLQEINVTETIMASGAMVAGGLVFTIPGIWIINPDAHLPMLPIMVMTVCGVLIGILFSALYRKKLIVEQQLVFPMGNAAFETMTTGIKKGKDSLKLLLSMGFSAVFAIVRDAFGWFPSLLTVFQGNGSVQPISLWLSPMALSIGAMIGKLSAFLWLGGALFGYLVLTPLGINLGFFSDFSASSAFRKNLGIGIMIGTGVGVFIKAVVDKCRKKKPAGAVRVKDFSPKTAGIVVSLVLLCSLLLAVGTELTFPQALLATAGAGLTTLLSGMLTGQCGTNPLEVFGILVMLVSMMLFKPSQMSLFLTTGVVSVACGLTGVLMSDFKSGYKLGTDHKQQLWGEAIGGVIGAVFSVFMLFIIKKSMGNFGTDLLPAPQASAVASMTSGIQNSPELLWGAVIGAFLYLLGIPSATLGLGFYLPIHISLSMGLGAILTMILKKGDKISDKDVSLVSSGFLGGEGIIGVIVAICSMFG
ncbi:MAG: OPT/YSL family transporter [Sphaerochaetaceae bacterium]